MILIYAPHPDFLPEDGWGRRIKAVDDIFNEKKKIYVWPCYSHSDTPVIQERLGAGYFECDFRRISHRDLLSKLVYECEFFYAHTVHSAPYLTPFYPTGKIITDLHGVAPEEDEYAGNFSASKFYNFYEKFLIEGSRLKIAVTQSMIDHYVKKYKDSLENFLLFPISNEMKHLQHCDKEKNLVIYAGGAQIWQKVDEMVRAVGNSPDIYEFIILSHQSEVFRNKIRNEKITKKITLDSVHPDQVYKYYERAQFGFLLRDDVLLNRVACPTKLIEYLSYGVLPIMENPNLGDFANLGGEYLSLEDFMSGDLPDETSIKNMVDSNYEVLKKINQQIEQAKEKISSFKALPSHVKKEDYSFLTLRTDSLAAIFPITVNLTFYSAQGEVIKKKIFRDLCELDYRLRFDIVSGASSLGVSLSYNPCSIQKLFLDTEGKKITSSDFDSRKNNLGSVWYFGEEFLFDLKNINSEKCNLVITLLEVSQSRTEHIQERLARRLINKVKKSIPKHSYLYKQLKLTYFLLRSLKAKIEKKKEKLERKEKDVDFGNISNCDLIVQCGDFLSGGLENVVIEQLKEFSKNSKVLFLVLGNVGVAYKEASSFASQSVVFRYNSRDYEKLILKAKPKFILMNYSFVGLEECAKLNVPIIQVIHNLYTWMLDKEKWAYYDRLIGKYIAVSSGVKDFSVKALGLPEGKIEIFENGIEPIAAFSKNEKLDARTLLVKSFDFDLDSFIFISPGSYTVQKNTLGLIQAFRKALCTNNKLKLICFGPKYDRNYFDKCKAYIEKHSLEGSIKLLDNQSKVRAFYLGADAGVIASFYEGGPLTFLEMLAYKLPILTTEVGVVSKYSNVPGVLVSKAPFNYDDNDIYFELTESWVANFANKMTYLAGSLDNSMLDNEELQKIYNNYCYKKYLSLFSLVK